ncbi:hypothetical protein [Streptomyces sp. NPDC000880]
MAMSHDTAPGSSHTPPIIPGCPPGLLHDMALRSSPVRKALRPSPDIPRPPRTPDQWCSDAIIHCALGGITHPAISRQSRPTYQQAIELPSPR